MAKAVFSQDSVANGITWKTPEPSNPKNTVDLERRVRLFSLFQIGNVSRLLTLFNGR